MDLPAITSSMVGRGEKKAGGRKEESDIRPLLERNAVPPPEALQLILMRALATICSVAVLFLMGCAHEGTIVRKQFRPLPFEYSLGVPGIFRFEVRDRAGHVQSQMVSATVFARYEVGDYFDDRQPLPPPAFRVTAPAPRFPPMAPPRPLQEYGTRYRN